MKRTALSVFSERPVDIEFSGEGRITGFRELTGAELPGLNEASCPLPFVAPGFLDMQVNGFLGSDYSLPDLRPEHIRKICRSLAGAGTTQHVPTIVTSPPERILKNLDTISLAMEKDREIRAAIAGIHIEGPFISEEDGPRGAHDPRFVRDPDPGEFREWQAAARGRIKIVTLAPERAGAVAFIERLREEGVIPAIGHTAADPEILHKAVAAGARISTHLGNGSHANLPRLRNYVWEQLAQDGLHAGLICDGFHLPPAVVKSFYRVKGPEKIILVSDAAFLGGCQSGLYKWGNLDVEVFPDGHLGLPGTTLLAGAAHLLDWDIPRFGEFTGASLGETIRLCTENPARLLELEEGSGALRAGSPANLTIFRPPRKEGGPLCIQEVFRRGNRVYPEDRSFL
jgi:N-acetylglucosamine-6-phosphate deacetylase